MNSADMLTQQKFETARRYCLKELAEPGLLSAQRIELQLRLHQALRGLGELGAAQKVLNQIEAADAATRFHIALLMAEDCLAMKSDHCYRLSDEAKAGLTIDEYQERCQQQFEECLERAREHAHAPEEHQRLAALTGEVPAGAPVQNAATPAKGMGQIECVIRNEEGSPAGGLRVTLGLEMAHEAFDPRSAGENTPLDQMGWQPNFQSAGVMTAVTDSAGRCRFDSVPAGRHEYIAVTKQDGAQPMLTHFLAQGIDVASGQRARYELVIRPWRSAAPEPIHHTLPETLPEIDGTCVNVMSVRNPFYYHFPRQLISMPLPTQIAHQPERLRVFCDADLQHPVPHQVINGDVTFFAELPECSERSWGLYLAAAAQPDDQGRLNFVVEPGRQTAVIHTGRASFRIPWGIQRSGPAPLLAVRGEDACWRGRGRFVLPAGLGISLVRSEMLDSGPLVVSVRLSYELSNHKRYDITWTAHEGEAYLLAEENSPDIEGAAFEFSLAEFTGGRGFLHWMPEIGNYHWSDLTAEDRELARLQESVAWWIPPQGFGYAMTAGDLNRKDYIAVYTQRRGDWIDRKFEKIAQGPGDDQRELDWPFPEMVGSTISMITAHTDRSGDCYFRFRFFDGRRFWGILASSLDRNDGPYKELSEVQHKNSSPRLQDFKEWNLDQQDSLERPSLVTRLEDLPALRAKRMSPAFQKIWSQICSGRASGPARGLQFAVEGDPQIAWLKKLELVGVAHVRARLTLLGRDFSDTYSPVGARPITRWVEDYDLIAGSGVFTPEEERLVRATFMLMGHLYMSPDFMNWKFNSRNANFEADRVDVVGAIGLAFQGNPDAAHFVEHAAELMEKSLNVYCTPRSGKWYENPSCYYLHAAKCRLNLAFHLASHGIQDPTEIPRLKDFLRWGVLLLTPPCPHSYDVMRDGASDAAYRSAEKVRRISPIGDHAHIGPWTPDHYALMSKLYRQRDPEFANLLLWAWQSGGSDGGYFGNLPLIFARLSSEDLEPAQAETLTSRRLEGFGAAFRGNFNQPNEFYLLLKQGPGGYRYHRTEGSFILFVDGKPLVYDGGEAGETWRHSTLSFGASHMPLAPGHVERFSTSDALDFVQGVHPVALTPGDPIFLSDLCEDRLVAKAYERFAEKNPADVRSILWIKDEYVVVHDDLALAADLLTHWHLQVVGDQHSGDAPQGYRFKGRFGTDLQVLLPDQTFTGQRVEQLPILEYHRKSQDSFSMRHLELSAVAPRSFAAVLRPLSAGKSPVAAEAIREGARIIGLEISGENLHDHLIMSREPQSLALQECQFVARYGAILRRPQRTDVLLLSAGRCAWRGLTIESSGPSVHLQCVGTRVSLKTEGSGSVTVGGLQSPIRLSPEGASQTMELSLVS